MIRIEIDVYVKSPFAAAASTDDDKILPLFRADGTVDRQAVSDWEVFIKNVALKIYVAFKVVNIERSPVEMNLTSREFRIYGRNSDGTINIEVVLGLRFSDHVHAVSHDVDNETEYANSVSKKNSPPDNSGSQPVEIAAILVKSKELGLDNSYDKYTQALKVVYQKMLEINEQMEVDTPIVHSDDDGKKFTVSYRDPHDIE